MGLLKKIANDDDFELYEFRNYGDLLKWLMGQL
jgi:hypothetical protein